MFESANKYELKIHIKHNSLFFIKLIFVSFLKIDLHILKI